MQTKEAYLTKRIVERAAKKGFKAAARATMKAMGYNVIVKDGNLVNQYPDGRIEIIRPLDIPEYLGPILLD